MEGKPIKKSVVIVSGGMDSVTLLYSALQLGNHHNSNVKALSFNYRQKHKKELLYAEKICGMLGVEHHTIDISSVNQVLISALTRKDQDIPEGHYAQSNMSQTVVPNRNAIMLSIAYGYAVSLRYDAVMFGAHAGDHPIYPDCRPDFVNKLDEALHIGNEGFGDVHIVAPFINLTKAQIVQIGLNLKVPYQETWSCYKGKNRPCLKCGTCVERTEAFMLNNIQDPALTEREWAIATGFYNLAKKQYEQTK
jgi:7-cyano-7-deazaguanine synthase